MPQIENKPHRRCAHAAVLRAHAERRAISWRIIQGVTAARRRERVRQAACQVEFMASLHPKPLQLSVEELHLRQPDPFGAVVPAVRCKVRLRARRADAEVATPPHLDAARIAPTPARGARHHSRPAGGHAARVGWGILLARGAVTLATSQVEGRVTEAASDASASTSNVTPGAAEGKVSIGLMKPKLRRRQCVGVHARLVHHSVQEARWEAQGAHPVCASDEERGHGRGQQGLS